MFPTVARGFLQTRFSGIVFHSDMAIHFCGFACFIFIFVMFTEYKAKNQHKIEGYLMMYKHKKMR